MGAAALRQDAHASRREAYRGNGVGAGQFGHQPHSAPTGPLFDDSVTSEEMREVLNTFKGAVMKRAGSRKWSKEDVDDIAQEALVYFANRLWTDQLKREPENRTPLHLHRALREHGGLLVQMIPRSSQDVMFGEQKIDHRDIKATALLQQEDMAFLAEHGRQMNNGERNRAAMRIRAEEFGDKKPTLEFHKRQTNVSVNQLVGTSPDGIGFEMGELMEARPFAAPQAFAHDTEALGKVESFEAAQGGYDLLERKTGHKKPVAADFGLTPDNAWNTLAEHTGAPTVTAQSLLHEQAKASGILVQKYAGEQQASPAPSTTGPHLRPTPTRSTRPSAAPSPRRCGSCARSRPRSSPSRSTPTGCTHPRSAPHASPNPRPTDPALTRSSLARA